VLQLRNGARLEGDDEIVFRAVDLEQAAGDGLYAADVAEATGLESARVTSALEVLVEREVLTATHVDPDLGPRYVRGPGL
jgi:hypothetical protein